MDPSRNDLKKILWHHDEFSQENSQAPQQLSRNFKEFESTMALLAQRMDVKFRKFEVDMVASSRRLEALEGVMQQLKAQIAQHSVSSSVHPGRNSNKDDEIERGIDNGECWTAPMDTEEGFQHSAKTPDPRLCLLRLAYVFQNNMVSRAILQGCNQF
jgi:hypothetical protein